MVENQLIDVVEVQKQIDQQKQVVQFKNELESDLEDEVPDLGDVVEEITVKIIRDSSIAMFCYEKRSSSQTGHQTECISIPLPSKLTLVGSLSFATLQELILILIGVGTTMGKGVNLGDLLTTRTSLETSSRLYRGKVSLKEGPPNHLSSQNFAISPLPILILKREGVEKTTLRTMNRTNDNTPKRVAFIIEAPPPFRE
ncbi:hypothetical protein Tco_0452603 [Tanacetum coccineum]